MDEIELRFVCHWDFSGNGWLLGFDLCEACVCPCGPVKMSHSVALYYFSEGFLAATWPFHPGPLPGHEQSFASDTWVLRAHCPSSPRSSCASHDIWLGPRTLPPCWSQKTQKTRDTSNLLRLWVCISLPVCVVTGNLPGGTRAVYCHAAGGGGDKNDVMITRRHLSTTGNAMHLPLDPPVHMRFILTQSKETAQTGQVGPRKSSKVLAAWNRVIC